MMPADEVIVQNPARRVVPALIAVSILIMFLPPLVLSASGSDEATKAIVGSICVAALALGFVYRAWKAPVEARFSSRSVSVRGGKESHYDLSQIRRWFFAVPVGLPTQNAPDSNAMIHVVFSDGLRFRGEVTREEAALLADWLPHAATTNVLADKRVL